MTDVPDVVQVTFVAPLGNSDHSSLLTAISIAQPLPYLCVSRKVLLKHRVNWTAVCYAIREHPWRCIWCAVNPVEILNVHLSQLVERFVLTKVIRVHNKDNPWFNEYCRLAFDIMQEAHLRWTRDRSRVNWDKFIHYERNREFSH